MWIQCRIMTRLCMDCLYCGHIMFYRGILCGDNVDVCTNNDRYSVLGGNVILRYIYHRTIACDQYRQY